MMNFKETKANWILENGERIGRAIKNVEENLSKEGQLTDEEGQKVANLYKGNKGNLYVVTTTFKEINGEIRKANVTIEAR